LARKLLLLDRSDDAADFYLVANAIDRYSVGDRAQDS
jgi:hypothetical protein